MNTEELEAIIEKLASMEDLDKASMGIQQFGGGPDESYIKANREGILKFARELLIAAKENKDSEDEKSIYPLLGDDDEWLDDSGEFFLHHIEISRTNNRATHISGDEGNWSSLLGIGCFVVVIAGLITFFVGIVTIFQWFI